ncbi:MAG: hypothetical protein ABIX28_01950 [Vicinamibacterales bacterium]
MLDETPRGLDDLADAPADRSGNRTGRCFAWTPQVLTTANLFKGKTTGVDATTFEANAALRCIVRHDSGETSRDFLTRLAQASGIETPIRV